MEIHAQRIRLRRAFQYSDYLSDRVAQFQNQRVFHSCQRAELSRLDGVRGDERREFPVFRSASWRVGYGLYDARRVPHRPRPEVPANDPSAISAKEGLAMDRLQLAV